jgi:ribonuclease D
MGAKEQERLKRLKVWRTSISASLSLDPSLIWPTVSLERISMAPNTLDIELKSGDIRHWQREHFASSLSVLLESL